jgi:hypothetical protein
MSQQHTHFQFTQNVTFTITTPSTVSLSAVTSAVANISVVVLRQNESYIQNFQGDDGHNQTKTNTTRRKIAIIIPFRDRAQHLLIFQHYMNQFLMQQAVEYRIFVIEQEKGNFLKILPKLMLILFLFCHQVTCSIVVH